MSGKVGGDRLTHFQRIGLVYPFLYTLGYRAYRGWLPQAVDPRRGTLPLTFVEIVALMPLGAWAGLFADGRLLVATFLFVLLAVALNILNERILVGNGAGTRFERDFDLLVTAERAWLGFYSLIIVALCFALSFAPLAWLALTHRT